MIASPSEVRFPKESPNGKDVNEGDIFLSFAIPTWNRCKELEVCLNSIVAEIGKSHARCEVIISDNGSTDKTEDVLRKYSEKYNFIRFSRNEVNQGFDLNLLKVVENSRGKYVWLFSDDDIIAENSLGVVIRTLSDYDPNYMSVGYDQGIIDDDGQFFITKRDKILDFNLKGRSLLLSNITFTDLIRMELHLFGFISINIFKRSLIDVNPIKEKLSNLKEFTCIYMVADATASGGGLILPHICVHYRIDNWKGRVDDMVLIHELPIAMKFVMDEFHVKKSVQRWYFRKTRRYLFGFRGFVLTTLSLKIKGMEERLGQIDRNMLTPYRIAYLKLIYPLLPKHLLIFVARRIMANRQF